MEKVLPEIEIEGTTFQFDINRIVLIEKNNPHNEIYFDHMRDEHTHYSFEYSAIRKNYYYREEQSPPDLLLNNPSGQLQTTNLAIIPVRIPRIGTIDPEGMCRKYGCSLQDIEQKSDFEVMVNQDFYNKRINGEPVTIDLAGKVYEIDVKNNSLCPQNGVGENIFLHKYHDYYDEYEQVYHLFYNVSENRVTDVIRDGSMGRMEDRVILEVPHLYILDPIGANQELGCNLQKGLMYRDIQMSHIAKPVPWQLYGIKVADEATFDQEAYYLRVNRGLLPTIEIAGHTFYVDLQMGKLRPKDDFHSKGIVFSDIERYYDLEQRTYTIPYNPKTHQFEEPDYLNIKEFPKDLIAVRFPSERLLDRIGWNRKYGFEITHGLAKNGLKLEFVAKNVPWKKTFLADLIKSNLKIKKKQKEVIEKRPLTQPKESKHKGRRM